MYDSFELETARELCEKEHLFFSRWFFKARQGIKFRVNWHHHLIADTLQEIIDGKAKNVTITVPPGSSKTEMVVINFIARGLAINPHARFLHLSGSDSLASLNSATAREIIRSDEFQAFWPMKIAEDASAKKRWNVEVDGKIAGGVYATSLGGQVTGFRAGHMLEGFQGCLLIDDPIKPEDAFSRVKLDASNRKLLTTVKSRKANPDTPIVVIMQRIAESDAVGFIKSGNLDGEWKHVVIPAVIDKAYIDKLPPKYQAMIDLTLMNEAGRMSYWAYKEPLEQLLRMERGDGSDASGSRISKHVFASQYQQNPVALGGNIIKGDNFYRYSVLPKIKYRKIFADTASKTKEYNDYSVFEEWGYADNGKIYLIDMIRGKWEAPELQRRAVAFWSKCKERDSSAFGFLREMIVEDKSSGTGLIQTLKLPPYNIQIKPQERDRDKISRVMDALPYIESGLVAVPENASFTNDFIAECEAFTADNSHDHDDQIDPMLDACIDLLSTKNKLKQWEKLAASENRPLSKGSDATTTKARILKENNRSS